MPEGLKITILNGVGLPGALAAVLAIEIKPGVTSGEYTFKIGIEIDESKLHDAQYDIDLTIQMYKIVILPRP